MSNTWTGLGIGTKDSKGDWLEMFFPEENISSSDINSSDKVFEKVIVNDSEAPLSVPEAYLKLHLLSYRLVKPNETNLDCLLYTSPSPRDATLSRMPSSA